MRLILTDSYDRPWTSDGFWTSWSKACTRAGVTGLTFHDLRGSAVVRLALGEATVPQIATFTGLSRRFSMPTTSAATCSSLKRC